MRPVQFATSRPSPRAFRPFQLGVLLLYVLLVALVLIVGMDRHPYDDSYFFKRFALNLLDHGALAWNIADGPVYGSTSQLHQLLVVALTAVTRAYTVFAVRVALACALCLGYVCALRTGARRGALAAPTLAFCSPVMLLSTLSGMDTALVFALLACLCDVCDPERERASPSAAPVVLVLAIWLARPDAVLLALPVWVGLHFQVHRKLPVRPLLWLAAAVAACLLWFRWYYGTAFPLPFYAKLRALSPYDAQFIALSEQSGRQRFSIFVWAALPLVLLAVQRLDFVNLVLVGTVVVFVSYHRITLVDVMGMHGRFYAPGLPVLALAASRAQTQPWGMRRTVLGLALYLVGVGVLVHQKLLPTGRLADDDNLTRAYYVLGTLAGVFVLVRGYGSRLLGLREGLSAVTVVMISMLATVVSFHPKRFDILSDTEYLLLHEQQTTVFRGLEMVRACFGDGIHVYHSEVGVVGLRFEHGTVTDLAGLLSPDWLFRRETFDTACLRDRPEALFLPHRNYAKLNTEIKRSRCIEGYVRVIKESSSPLYIRSDLYERYQGCVRSATVP